MGMENSKFPFCMLSSFVINTYLFVRRAETIVGTIFGHTYTAKPVFALQDRCGAFQVFMEV